jgi:transposase
VYEILRLKHECGAIERTIGQSLGIARSTVAVTLDRLAAAALSWPLPATLSDRVLEAMLYAGPGTQRGSRRKAEPDWTHVHYELRRPGVTLMLLWEEHRQREPGGHGYSRWCELYRAWEGRLSPTMRQARRAGELMFVDYAGQTVELIDGRSGEIRQAQIFVAVMGASSYTYAEASWTQTLPDWIGSHARALAFMGGVPAQVVPDNPKVGVTRANWYEPGLNRTYLDLATHYGTADRADAHPQAARQSQGRSRGSGGRALDPGTAAQPPFSLARRVEPGDRRADRRSQRAADPTLGRQPPRSVPRARPRRR